MKWCDLEALGVWVSRAASWRVCTRSWKRGLRSVDLRRIMLGSPGSFSGLVKSRVIGGVFHGVVVLGGVVRLLLGWSVRMCWRDVALPLTIEVRQGMIKGCHGNVTNT